MPEKKSPKWPKRVSRALFIFKGKKKIKHRANPSQNTSFLVFYSQKSILFYCQLWLLIAQMQYSDTKHAFLSASKRKIRFVQVSTMIWNCTNAVLHRKIRLFVRCTVENQLCASANADFKLRKCNNPWQNTSFWVENPILAIVYSNFKLHKCNIPPQNMSFWVFWSRKSDLCKCQFWLETAQMRYSTPKHVFFYVLPWKISIVQVPTLTLNHRLTIINRKTRLLECLTEKNPICATVNSDFKL